MQYIYICTLYKIRAYYSNVLRSFMCDLTFYSHVKNTSMALEGMFGSIKLV